MNKLGTTKTNTCEPICPSAGQSVETLEAQLRLYEKIARNVEDCIWSQYLEPDCHIALITEGIRGLTGYSPAEFVDNPHLWEEIVYPEDRARVRQDYDRLRQGTELTLCHRLRIVREDGELRWAYAHGRVERDEHGLRVDGIIADITDQVRLEEKMRRADRLSAVGLLAGGIAHEYNNLHFAILGTLDLLLMRPDLDESIRQPINRVRESAERASDITNKLVSFARGGMGGYETVAVSELIEATVGMVQKEFSTSGIEMNIHESPLPLWVRGNRAELGQVLINLVINAQQAIVGGTVKRLNITTGLMDGKVFISVADTGHGIAPENMSRLFDPFFTTKGAAGSWLEGRSKADAYLPGRGLGLSVAQTIVQEHGGEIEVDSEVDCGTRFIVYLPVASVEREQTETDKSNPVHKGRILIADDEETVREVCRELLVSLDYDVAEAEGGAEALEILGCGDFDLVLVDLQMPDMEGLELVRRINEIPAPRRPAKLIITGNIADLAPETCTELGISGLLQKRSSLSELVSKVQLALASQ